MLKQTPQIENTCSTHTNHTDLQLNDQLLKEEI